MAQILLHSVIGPIYLVKARYYVGSQNLAHCFNFKHVLCSTSHHGQILNKDTMTAAQTYLFASHYRFRS